MESLRAIDYEWILCRDNLLKDDHIDHFAFLMYRQFGFSFQESWKIQVPELIEPIDANSRHIQLLHSRDGNYDENHHNDSSDHWVCSYYDTQTIYILDSTWTPDKRVHPKWLIYLTKLYPFYRFDINPIVFVPVQRQANSTDCGVFAMAFATAIVSGQYFEISAMKFDTRRMRQHIVQMFQQQRIMPFPCITAMTRPESNVISRGIESNIPISDKNDRSNDESLTWNRETRAGGCNKYQNLESPTGNPSKFQNKKSFHSEKKNFRRGKSIEYVKMVEMSKQKREKFNSNVYSNNEELKSYSRMHVNRVRSLKNVHEDKSIKVDNHEESSKTNINQTCRLHENLTMEMEKSHNLKQNLKKQRNVKATSPTVDAVLVQISQNKYDQLKINDDYESQEIVNESYVIKLDTFDTNSEEIFQASRSNNEELLQHQVRQGSRLHDDHIRRFSEILQTCSNYQPRDTLYLRRPKHIKPVLSNQKHIQILYSSNAHWVCSYYDCKKIYIYDSLNLRNLHSDHIIFLQHLFPFYRVVNQNVTFCRVQNQLNCDDCGVYAIAFAVSLLYCQKPDLITYDYLVMREHLCNIYDKNEISHFPVVMNRNLHSNLLPLDKIREKELRAYRKRKLREAKNDDLLVDLHNSKRIKLTSIERNEENAHYAREEAKITQMFDDNQVNSMQLKREKRQTTGKKLSTLPINKKILYAKRVKAKYRKMDIGKNFLKPQFPREFYIQKFTSKMNTGCVLEDRLEAEKLIKWSFQQRKYYTSQLYRTLERLKRKADVLLSNQKQHGTVEKRLQSICGKSKHRASSESYFYETTYSFEDLKNMIIVMNEKGQAVNILPLIPNKKKIKHWKCSHFCHIYEDEVLNNCSSLLETLKNQKLRSFPVFLKLVLGQSHSGNKRGYLSYHYTEKICHSKFLSTLQLLSPHFPTMRYIRDLIYQMNVLFGKLNFLDKALNIFEVDTLKETVDNLKDKAVGIIIHTDVICLDEDLLQEEFKEAFLAFTKRSLDTPSYVCVSCHKLCFKRDVTSLSKLRKPIFNPVWDDLIYFYVNNSHGQLVCGKPIYEHDTICTYCLNNFRTKPMPPTCILNNLYVGEIPDEMKNLNDQEKILLQRAKAFQVVQRAGTIANKKLPHTSRIQKLKGQTFYLPLPLQETLRKICPENNPINENHQFFILVRGIPTKSNIVWENLVNIEKIFKALLKLKEINPFYSNIRIPESATELFGYVTKTEIEYTIDSENDKNNNVDNPGMNMDLGIENGNSSEKAALLTQVLNEGQMYAKYTIQPMHDQRINDSSTNLYQMLKVRDVPLNHYLKSLDVLCFPDLYPFGKNGLHEERSERLTDSAYIKTRLLSADSRFRLNQQYLFFLQHDAYNRQINSGIYHLLNVTNPKERLNANQYLEKLEKGELEGRIDTIFERVRNSEQYWRIPRNDLDCMIQNYGPATWFLTVSPAEWLWDDLIYYLRSINSPYCDKLSPGELIAADPVSVSRFIDNKFHAILDFILSDSHPIGKITHYFWRREYQGRGIPHFHMIIWVQNAPILGVHSSDDIIAFISKYATCKIPQKSVSPNLYRRVTTHQKHRHTTYCLRVKKAKGQTTKVCRFGFSRPVTETFVMRSAAVSVANRKQLKTKSRLYELPRTKDEENINDYNPAILSVWEGNMDIQFIGEQSGLLTTYCTKYASKPEVANAEIQIMNDINQSKPVRQILWNVACRSLNHREVGAIEVADTLMGLPLYRTDPETVIRWLDVKQVRNRRIKPREYIKQLNPESTDLFYDSLIDDYYPARPAELEPLSLYDFAKWFDVMKTKPNSKKADYYELKNNVYVKRREHGYLINHYKYNPNIQPENYYFSLLLLFKPWRDIDELKGTFKTFTESFMYHKDQLLEAYEYHEKLEKIQEAFEKVKMDIEQEMEKENHKEDSDDEILLGCDPIEAEAAMQDFRDINTKVDQTPMDMEELINQLNDDQKRIFEKVKNAVNNDKGALRLYISGEGGTGKSFLIEVIQRWIQQEMPYDVAITAPTGLAAFNINGLTIHKILQLPVEHGSKILKYRQLSDKALKVLRQQLQNISLIIIDEISMVSNLTLLFIHLRLVEIFNSINETDDGWFGGKHLLVFGDLLQLPPVRANPPFIKLTQSEMEKHVGALATVT